MKYELHTNIMPRCNENHFDNRRTSHVLRRTKILSLEFGNHVHFDPTTHAEKFRAMEHIGNSHGNVWDQWNCLTLTSIAMLCNFRKSLDDIFCSKMSSLEWVGGSEVGMWLFVHKSVGVSRSKVRRSAFVS